MTDKKIVTGIPELDEALSGSSGARKRLTYFAGRPSGKTMIEQLHRAKEYLAGATITIMFPTFEISDKRQDDE